jgi:membrane protein DedA with SNARE-associated domain
VNETIAFLARHGEAVLFVYVFADQVGVPLPAIPVLLAAGALAGAGKLSFPVAVALSVAASLVADFIWYFAGRLRGARVLGVLCRVALEPDACVRRTENAFLRHGIRSLIFAKFVPGLSTVAPPLAGIFRVSVPRFALYSAAAALLWATAWMGLGYALRDALERAAAHVSDVSSALVATVTAIIVVYVAFKWVQRRRFLGTLRIARLSADELKGKLDAGEAVVIVDLRTALDAAADPHVIPGAIRMTAEEIEQRHHELPRDVDLVVYCS